MLALYACLQDKSIESEKNMTCVQEKQMTHRAACYHHRMTHFKDETVTTDQLLSVAVEAAKAAGGVLLDYAKRGFTVEFKNAIDLVTDADRAAEQCIIDHVRGHFPTHRTLAEERGLDAHAPSRYR
jgi:hypothetical protein